MRAIPGASFTTASVNRSSYILLGLTAVRNGESKPSQANNGRILSTAVDAALDDLYRAENDRRTA